MDEVEIKKLVIQGFVEAFEIEPARLRSEMRIFEDLGIDSLDIVDLVVATEEV